MLGPIVFLVAGITREKETVVVIACQMLSVTESVVISIGIGVNIAKISIGIDVGVVRDGVRRCG